MHCPETTSENSLQKKKKKKNLVYAYNKVKNSGKKIFKNSPYILVYTYQMKI